MATLYNDGLVGIDSPHLNDDKFGYENPKRYDSGQQQQQTCSQQNQHRSAGPTGCRWPIEMGLQQGHVLGIGLPSGIEQITQQGNLPDDGIEHHIPHHSRQGRPRNTEPRSLKDDESGEHGTDGVSNSRNDADNRVQSDAELGPGDLERIVQQPRQELEPFDLRRSMGGHDGYRRGPMQWVCHG